MLPQRRLWTAIRVSLFPARKLQLRKSLSDTVEMTGVILLGERNYQSDTHTHTKPKQKVILKGVHTREMEAKGTAVADSLKNLQRRLNFTF